MTREGWSGSLYHLARELPYNHNSKLELGSTLAAGNAYNPFFAYYEKPGTVVATLGGQDVKISSKLFLEMVVDGRITPNENYPQTAVNVARHFELLAREVIMETVRREAAPLAPSRQTCLWAVESFDEAQYWLSRLGGRGRLLRLEGTGTVHRADASLLAAGTEAYSAMIAKAQRYWTGGSTEKPEWETLFSGKAVVVEVVSES